MKLGKLPPEVLSELLGRFVVQDESVLVGPRVGEDAAAVTFGDRALVAAMDPITFTVDFMGWYAVQVNANDIAVMGAQPRWFLATLLLPADSSGDELPSIFDQIASACEELGIAPVGGHTETTAAVTQPVLIGCMLGEAPADRLVMTGGARAADAVVLCGSAAVEGTAILARDAPHVLLKSGLSLAEVEAAAGYLFDPGISVVAAARAAAQVGVTAMHDPTEGGIATGLLELALASRVGLEIDGEAIPVTGLTRRVCAGADIDPLGLIASGALLACVRPDRAEALLTALGDAGVSAAVIGRTLPEEAGLTLTLGGRKTPLPRFERDELARFFEERER